MQTPWTSTVTAALPAHLADDARTVAGAMPGPRCTPGAPFAVDVLGETVAIPHRIHTSEPPAVVLPQLTATQRTILHCLYSRHSDGLVRQRHLEEVVASTEPWVVPFVLRLAGEYVLEIVSAIRTGLPDLAAAGSTHHDLYGEFIARNPGFFATTERRVVSYWACYHRWRYPEFAAYPGALLLEALRRTALSRQPRPAV
ncbi:hypothetical protein [Streptomyces sp. 1331.2]|uniref:hypothetical protein n=1 Tax=Streptomyces sp. 1331.2 TaxID=1938835 RepID=UPI00117D8FD6|nr:hypothetical protein [Streptomyces sp. 1331.2]